MQCDLLFNFDLYCINQHKRKATFQKLQEFFTITPAGVVEHNSIYTNTWNLVWKIQYSNNYTRDWHSCAKRKGWKRRNSWKAYSRFESAYEVPSLHWENINNSREEIHKETCWQKGSWSLPVHGINTQTNAKKNLFLFNRRRYMVTVTEEWEKNTVKMHFLEEQSEKLRRCGKELRIDPVGHCTVLVTFVERCELKQWLRQMWPLVSQKQ